MSKLKSVFHGARAVASVCGAVGVVTGHGLITAAAGAMRVRIHPGQARIIANYQLKSAKEQWKLAEKEWEK